MLAANGSTAASQLFRDLSGLLSYRNGFFAFESALHVFPSSPRVPFSLESWNRADLWRSEYPPIPEEVLFFAEDIFGDQFALKENGISRFESETGAFKPIAATLDDFIGKLLTDYRQLTGFDFAHEWQAAHGALRLGQRLAPKVPFVLGGAYHLDNLYAAEQVDLMRLRGHIAKQIAAMPDGAKIKIKIDER